MAGEERIIECSACGGRGETRNWAATAFLGVCSFGMAPMLDEAAGSKILKDECDRCGGNGYLRLRSAGLRDA